MGPLDGKVAIVTGASRGIGRAIALELARAGARVALNYRTGEARARAVEEEIVAIKAASVLSNVYTQAYTRQVGDGSPSSEGGVMVADGGSDQLVDSGEIVMLAQADVSNGEEARSLVRRVVDKWGRLDILVNNAGITRDKTLRKLSDDDWVAVINTNLNSAFYCTSAAIQVMMEQKSGRIINISSLIGQTGNIGQSNYAAAKGGMIAFTKSAALEMAKYNVTVNTVVPGFTATDMVNAIPEDIQNQIKAKIPLGRFAQPEEIARAVLFLVADGGYITGQQINVNGGMYL